MVRIIPPSFAGIKDFCVTAKSASEHQEWLVALTRAAKLCSSSLVVSTVSVLSFFLFPRLECCSIQFIVQVPVPASSSDPSLGASRSSVASGSDIRDSTKSENSSSTTTATEMSPTSPSVTPMKSALKKKESKEKEVGSPGPSSARRVASKDKIPSPSGSRKKESGRDSKKELRLESKALFPPSSPLNPVVPENHRRHVRRHSAADMTDPSLFLSPPSPTVSQHSTDVPAVASPTKPTSPAQQIMARRPSENVLHRPAKGSSFDFAHALDMAKLTADVELEKFIENISAALLRLRLAQGIPVELLPTLSEERQPPNESNMALEKLRDIAKQLVQLTPDNLLVCGREAWLVNRGANVFFSR